MTSFTLHLHGSSSVSRLGPVRNDRFIEVTIAGNKRMSRKWYTKRFTESLGLCGYANRLLRGKWITESEYDELYLLGLISQYYLEGDAERYNRCIQMYSTAYSRS